jgi:hypothetical protein
VGVVIGLAVLVLLIYLSVLLSLAAPAYVMEGIGVFAALSCSRNLVRGAWLQSSACPRRHARISIIAKIAVAGVAGAATSFGQGGVPGPGFYIAIGLFTVTSRRSPRRSSQRHRAAVRRPAHPPRALRPPARHLGQRSGR